MQIVRHCYQGRSWLSVSLQGYIRYAILPARRAGACGGSSKGFAFDLLLVRADSGGLMLAVPGTLESNLKRTE